MLPYNRPNSHNKTTDSQFQVESSDNMEIGAKILRLRTCTAPKWKTALRYLSYLCSGFLLYLINIWIPSVFVTMSVQDTEVDDADKVVIYCADKHIEVLPLTRERTSTQTLKVFYLRLSKYYFDETDRIFRRCQFNFDKLTCDHIYKEFGNGLSEQTVLDQAILYGRNSTVIPSKSCLELLVQEILSPFYVFQAYSFTIWFIDYYYIYTVMLIIFTAISIGFTLYETMRTTNKLRKMFHYEIPVYIHRQIESRPQRIQVNSSELVPGDLVEIPEGVFMPCDAILFKGTCVMNESMLTGESIPVLKTPLPRIDIQYNIREDKQYTLFAGTKCIQTKASSEGCALALVTSTGFTTVKGELIRTMMFPKPTDFKFYADSLKFVSGLFVLAIIGFVVVLPSLLEENDGISIVRIIIIKGSEIVTVAVPPALPTCIQIGITIALSRLKNHKIFCISPNKINEAARVNVMCFDKTGTLTEDDLDLFGVRPVLYEQETNKTAFIKAIKDLNQLSKNPSDNDTAKSLIFNSPRNKLYSSQQLMEIMASCHSLTTIKEDLVGDPLDIKMFRATKWLMEENNDQKRDPAIIATIRPVPDPYRASVYRSQESGESNMRGVDVVKRFEFSSSLQRMSVIVRDVSGTGLRVHIKGSPEKIQELCRYETIPDDYYEVLQKYTKNGYRVLACGTKSVGDDYSEVVKMKRDDLEHSFAFAGFLIMENKLKTVTTEVIDVLHEANIRTIMVTGDNVLTAISVAKHCHIIGHNQKIFLGDIADEKIGANKTIIWKNFSDNERTGRDLGLEMEKKADAFDFIAAANSLNGIDDSLMVEKLNKPKGNPWLQKVPLLPEPVRADSIEDKEHTVDDGRKDSRQSLNMGRAGASFLEVNDYEDYCIAVTGKAFSLIINEAEVNKDHYYQGLLSKLLKKGVVFARMHPDEKALMIKKLMSIPKNVVGMCGDGANDVGALKTANVGVSLSEAEASIAAPFTSNIQDISCVPTLLREGKAALSTSYQEFKYMALFAIIMFSGMILLYYHLMDFTDWDYYYNEIFIVLPLSSTMGMSRTYKKLTTAKPSERLISAEILISVIGQGIIQASFQFATFFILISQPWYNAADCSNDFDTGNACVENTSLYIVTNYQYCITAFVFMVGRPFKEPFYSNFWFTLVFVVMMLLNLLVHYNPFAWQFLYDQVNWAAEVPLEMSWKNTLLGIVVVNTAITFLWEEFAVKYISFSWKRYKGKSSKVTNSRVRVYEPPANHSPPSIQNNLNCTASEPSVILIL